MISIIPAIDIIEGKCVRLSQGDYNKKIIYNEDPLEVAKMFENHGLRRLHLVDLDGAKTQHVVNLKVLERIASKTSLFVDFGGGIKSDADIEAVFNSGAAMATAGSIAVTNRHLFLSWLKRYGKEKIILGADIKDNKIAISGWLSTGNYDIFSFIDSYLDEDIGYVLCTEVSKDGMMQGSALSLYRELKQKYPSLHIIASGGISSVEEIEKLNAENIYGAVIGKAIYEGLISLKQLQQFL